MSHSDGRALGFEDELSDASNVLLLAPSIGDAGDEGCRHLLDLGSGAEADVLCVTLTDSPDNRRALLEMDREQTGVDKTGFVAVGDTTRSVATETAGDIGLPATGVSIETISSPADMTGIGMKVSTFLNDWAADGNRVVVCFHSLTTLLQYVDLRDAFRFLHLLTGRLKAVDATAHYHMDPAAHDEREVNTLKSLFDAVVEADENDEWTVRTRS